MQQPSIGRVVITTANADRNNGSSEAPAVITRVFGERPDGGWTINVRQLLDGHDVEWLTSIALYADEVTALAALPTNLIMPGRVTWWPPRV